MAKLLNAAYLWAETGAGLPFTILVLFPEVSKSAYPPNMTTATAKTANTHHSVIRFLQSELVGAISTSFCGLA